MIISKVDIQNFQEAGQAIYGIASVIEEDVLRKEAGEGTDFLRGTELSCLLSALKLLGTRIWDENARLLDVINRAEEEGAK